MANSAAHIPMGTVGNAAPIGGGDLDHADETARLRAELDAMRAERDQLRACVLGMVEADERRAALAVADAQAIGAEQYASGYRDGYERGARSLDDQWAAHWNKRIGWLSEDIETRRWGPGGRASFADPRPGDRSGEQIIADAEASWKPFDSPESDR